MHTIICDNILRKSIDPYLRSVIKVNLEDETVEKCAVNENLLVLPTTKDKEVFCVRIKREWNLIKKTNKSAFLCLTPFCNNHPQTEAKCEHTKLIFDYKRIPDTGEEVEEDPDGDEEEVISEDEYDYEADGEDVESDSDEEEEEEKPKEQKKCL